MEQTKDQCWEQVAPWLQLHLTQGLGALRIARLVEHFGEVNSVLNADLSALRDVLTPSVAINIVNLKHNKKIAEQIARIRHWFYASDTHFILCPDSMNYPPQLRELVDYPPALFLVGDVSLLCSPQVAIVGSRKPTLQGRKLAETIARDLACDGLTITSGLAMGIDACAHYGAMTASNASIAVIGTGIDRVYPAENRLLAKQMEQYGLIVSEFPLGTPPLAGNFPKRNRIISGLSLGVLVVEATERSGSLITARLALEQGREVFAMPGAVSNIQSQGCHRLIREGAVLVLDAKQIVAELQTPLRQAVNKQNNYKQSTSSDLEEISHFTDTDAGVNCPVQKSILQAIGSETWFMDELILHLDIPQEPLSYALTMLELEGRVALTSSGYRKP